jgi:hypothetical protein
MRTITLLLLFGFHAGMAQHFLVMKEITKEISMGVPFELKPEPASRLRTTSETLALFMTGDFKTDLSVTKFKQQWSHSDEELLYQFYKANILNLHDHVQMHEEGFREVNGKRFLVFEFTGTIVDKSNTFKEAKKVSAYNYVMYAIEGDGILAFRFTCPADRQSYWQKIVRESMASVKFAKSK